MKRILKAGAAVLAAWIVTAPARGVPPPPPGGGGGIKPPDTAPPGRLYFEDNVVIVGPGFSTPDSGGGTLFVNIDTLNPDTVNPGGKTPGDIVNRVVREVSQVKSQVEAASVALPPGLLNPASVLYALLNGGLAGHKVFRDDLLLTEESGPGEPAAAGGGTPPAGVAVKTASDAPAPRPSRRSAAGEPVVPSYWQLPIR